jgi:lipopolysaccharide transport system permease protein
MGDDRARVAGRVVIQAAPVLTRRLQPSQGWSGRTLSEVWAYRELLYFFIWRDVKVRYKQTLLGAGWAIIQPLMSMVVFTIFFGRLAKVPSDGLPYPVFSLMALVPWTYFASALSGCSTSLSGYQHIISKVYFPRLIVPWAAVIAPLVDFAIGCVILALLMAWFHITPSASIVWLPLFLLLAIASAAGVGVWLAALNVRYRDVRYVVPFVLQLWMFATPVAYPASLVPGRWRAVYFLNPMAGVIEGFRWALAGGPPPGALTLVSAAVVVVLILGGAVYFRRLEGTFADVI